MFLNISNDGGVFTFIFGKEEFHHTFESTTFSVGNSKASLDSAINSDLFSGIFVSWELLDVVAPFRTVGGPDSSWKTGTFSERILGGFGLEFSEFSVTSITDVIILSFTGKLVTGDNEVVSEDEVVFFADFL